MAEARIHEEAPGVTRIDHGWGGPGSSSLVPQMAQFAHVRFSARAARYARVGANVGGVAARLAGARFFGLGRKKEGKSEQADGWQVVPPTRLIRGLASAGSAGTVTPQGASRRKKRPGRCTGCASDSSVRSTPALPQRRSGDFSSRSSTA